MARVLLLLLAALAALAAAKIIQFDGNDPATAYMHKHTEVLLGCDDCRASAGPANPTKRPMIRFEGLVSLSSESAAA